MTLPILLFFLGLIVLVKCGDVFVNSSIALARRFHLSELFIGTTIVSIGTTLPEVTVSITAALSGQSQLAYGNAVGSVICNTALIAGLSLAIRPLPISKFSFVNIVIAFFLAAGFCIFISYSQGGFPRGAGLLLVLGFCLYTFVSIRKQKGEPPEAESGVSGSFLFHLVYLVIGAAGLYQGSHLMVDNAQILALALGVSTKVIGLSIVALGTSLPELTTAVIALVKGHSQLSIGNILGANFFNLTLVLGGAALVAPAPLPASSNPLELTLMLVVMGILTIPPLLKGRTYSWQGILLLLLYIGYLIILF